MRSISRWLNRFSYNHPKFSIPNLMTYIVAGNAIVWLLDRVTGGLGTLWLAFIPSAILQGQVWRVVTFILVPSHSDFLYLALSLFMYYFLGTQLERIWGSTRFTLYYLIGTALTILCGLALCFTPLRNYTRPLLSMSYVNLSLFLAFATLFPDAQFRIYFFIPIRGKWLALVYIVMIGLDVVSYLDFRHILISDAPLAALSTWLRSGTLLLAAVPLVSLLNWLMFFWDDLFRSKKPAPTRVRRSPNQQPTDLRTAQQQVQKQQGYLHKCAVCGITDRDDKNMEFRYCSKCEGYYCYCANHINNHTHVQ